MKYSVNRIILLVVMAIVSLTALNANATSYIYDSLNRLTRASYANGSFISYTYDPAGNILKVDTYNATIPIPVATTHAADALSITGATLHATVNAKGEETSIIFEYGTTTAYGSTITADQSPLISSSDIAVTATLSGLAAETTIHYRVVAINTNGTGTGTDLLFTTYSVTEGSDDDGIADAWEMEYFGDLTTANGRTDYDQDGYLDIIEYENGTDPIIQTAPGGSGYNQRTDNRVPKVNPAINLLLLSN